MLQFGHHHGQVGSAAVSWFVSICMLMIIMELKESLNFGHRNIMLDVDWREAINKDEDQVPRSGIKPGHSILRHRSSDIRRCFCHQH